MRNIIKYVTLLLFLLLLTKASCADLGVGIPGSEKVETPEQLLALVNARLRQMDRTPFTMRQLTIWIAEQANAVDEDTAMDSRVALTLRNIKKEKVFIASESAVV